MVTLIAVAAVALCIAGLVFMPAGLWARVVFALLGPNWRPRDQARIVHAGAPTLAVVETGSGAGRTPRYVVRYTLVRLSDGAVIGQRVGDGTAAFIAGQIGDTLWIDAQPGGLHALSLPDLRPVTSAERLLAGHPALARTRQVRVDGAMGRLTALGTDGFFYGVDPSSGRIGRVTGQASRDVRIAGGPELFTPEVPRTDGGRLALVGGPRRALQVRDPSGRELAAPAPDDGYLEGRFVRDRAADRPILGGAGEGALIEHGTEISGLRSERKFVLTRVSPDGAVQWTRRADQIIPGVRAARYQHEVVWASSADGVLVLVTHAHRPDDRRTDNHVVALDLATGATRWVAALSP